MAPKWEHWEHCLRSVSTHDLSTKQFKTATSRYNRMTYCAQNASCWNINSGEAETAGKDWVESRRFGRTFQIKFHGLVWLWAKLWVRRTLNKISYNPKLNSCRLCGMQYLDIARAMIDPDHRRAQSDAPSGSRPDQTLSLNSRPGLLKGSWDLLTRVIIRVTLLIATYNPN